MKAALMISGVLAVINLVSTAALRNGRMDKMHCFLLVLVFLLAACVSEENPLTNTEWQLVEMGRAGEPAGVRGIDALTAQFTSMEDMTGWTGCNSYGARYSVSGLELRLASLEWTEAGCPSQELFRQEQQMQDLLATVERFDVTEKQLTLHSEGRQVLVFERVVR